jgi:FAD binding domain
MSDPNTLSEAALSELRGQIRGQVLTASDTGYDQAIAAWNLAAIHTPTVVVVAELASDIAAAVRAAAQARLGIGIQATGHGSVRPVDGMLIVTRRMDAITIHPAARIATVAAGATAGPVLAAAQEHGLAPLIGSSPTVGVVGLTLGGGLGWLSRKYGPACDAARSFEVVTPDGSPVHASANENEELFRALRGGGGGVLGVVTAMEIDLVPVTTVYGGSLLYPASAAVEVAEHYAWWVGQAPDDLTSSLVYMNFPPLPQVPEPLRGQSFTIVRGCWSGDLADGQRFVDTFRNAMPPAMDVWSEMPFGNSAAIGADPIDPMPVAGCSSWLTDLDGEVAAAIAANTFPSGGPPPVVFSEIRHLGGAMSAANDESVMGNRDRQFLFQSSGLNPETRVAMTPAQGRLLEALGPYRSGATSLNFMAGEERRSATQSSTDAARHDELAALQARLDPDNLLRFGVTHLAD